MLHSRSLLVVYFIHGSVSMLTCHSLGMFRTRFIFLSPGYSPSFSTPKRHRWALVPRIWVSLHPALSPTFSSQVRLHLSHQGWANSLLTSPQGSTQPAPVGQSVMLILSLSDTDTQQHSPSMGTGLFPS